MLPLNLRTAEEKPLIHAHQRQLLIRMEDGAVFKTIHLGRGLILENAVETTDFLARLCRNRSSEA